MRQIALRYWLVKGFFTLFLFICAAANGSDASITISWQPPELSEDGSMCTDLAGYKIYYAAERSGLPYSGTGLAQGDSPVTVPLSSIADPSNPELVLSGLTAGATYYIAVTAYDSNLNESGYSNETTAVEVAAIDPAVNTPPAPVTADDPAINSPSTPAIGVGTKAPDPAVSSGGGGGGGCRVSQNQAGSPDGILLFIPPLALLVLKRMHKL